MKKIIALFVLLALTLSIVACSDSNSNTLSCENCDAENVLGSKYCSSCGASLETTINSSDKNNNNESNNSENNDSREVVELTKYNYNTYLSININMQSQTPTLISNTYLVTYQSGRSPYTKEYTGLTPPTDKGIISCTHLYSTYSLNTTFSVTAHSRDAKYSFDNSSFTLVYRSSSSSFSDVTVYLDENGVGTSTFMITERVSSASKNYSYKASDLINSAKGTVSYVE